MNQLKEEILNHQLYAIDFVSSLQRLSKKEWRKPIAEGKWTIAEVVGHFQPWDDFILNKRLPCLFKENDLPKGPDSETTNARSADVSRTEEQQTTINRFVATRQELYKVLSEIPDSRWDNNFKIGTTTLSLYEYLSGLTEHDQHHFSQIKRVMKGAKT